MTRIRAKKGVFTIGNTNHWINNAGGKMDRVILTHHVNLMAANKLRAISLFKNEHDPQKIRKTFRNFKNCEIKHIQDSSEGLLVSLQCVPTNLDKAVTEIVANTDSSVWLKKSQDKDVQIIVQNPWTKTQPRLRRTVEDIIRKQRLTLLESSEVVSSTIDIQVPKAIGEENIDEQDKKIAETLLLKGYYKTPRPSGLTQDKISEELGITKPTLEARMRKIHSRGIENILGLTQPSKEDLALGWKTLETKIRSSESKSDLTV